MKVLLAASECVPFVKTGGLADVAGALPKALAKEDIEVSVVLPLYKEISEKWRDQLHHELYFYVNLGWRRQYCGVESLVLDGVHYYFIDNEYYFGRPSVYGYGGDEGERFAFLARAVLEALPLLNLKPDVIHCNDWQTGMIPVLLKRQYTALPFYDGIKTVFTIHNLQYQGVFGIDYIEDILHLGWDMYQGDKLEFYGACSFMKGGLIYADEITTVSPTYAKEIQTPYYGERLDGVLRARQNHLSGILNGIDVDAYNPSKDRFIPRNYNAVSYVSSKAFNKASLQQELDLDIRPDVPLIGIISRLTPQKGFDLIEYVLPEIMEKDVQIVVLGLGDDKFINFFGWAAYRYKGKFAAKFEMNEELAHKIYSACDFFLMPSAFEPCGLSQMIAMRYGTVPIVRETGGLKDTVEPFHEEDGTGRGFTFYSYNAHDMLGAIDRALSCFTGNEKSFRKAIRNCMKANFSWDASAHQYALLYKNLCQQEEVQATKD